MPKGNTYITILTWIYVIISLKNIICVKKENARISLLCQLSALTSILKVTTLQIRLCVFYIDITFIAHIASVHGKNWSKSANKQARTLELEFTLAPRNRQTEQYSRLNRKPYDKRNDRSVSHT